MPRNIAILVLDSVRKDLFDRRASRIQSMSEASFEHAYAPSSWSTPSHASMFTGELPSDHGVHTYQRSFEHIQSSLFTTELSHETLGVSANIFAGSSCGFDRSFDRFNDVNSAWRYPEGLDPQEFGVGSGSYADYAQFVLAALASTGLFDSLRNGIAGFLHTRWKQLPGPKLVDDSGRGVCRIAERTLSSAEEPWFLFANMMDAHIPLQHFVGLEKDIHLADWSWCSDEHDVWELIEGKYPEYWSIRESVYEAYIEYLDRIVAHFIGQMMTSTSNPTTVLITADHGENHGEQSAMGMTNHKSSLSEQLLHVPLEIINPPCDTPETPDRFTLLDLPELVRTLINDKWIVPSREVIPAEVMGMSAGPEPPEDADVAHYTRTIRAAYQGDTKFVWDSLGGVKRYEVDPSIPSNQTLIERGVSLPDWAKQPFSVEINEARRAAQVTGNRERNISDAVESRLERLGYR